MTRRGPTRALLIYPRFNPNSFWNYQATCEVMGARYPAAPLGLITVAAMLPPSWEVRLVNRNAEELTDEHLAWADVVLTGGMMPQQPDALRLIELAHQRGLPVVVGGPDASSSPHVYAAADFLVVGEAEEILGDFVRALEAGETTGVFKAERFADVTRSPVPRFDLLNLEHYLHVGVQWSRGCPFNCEFCDIIELYGRVPRTKPNAQMLAELDALHALGYRGHVDFVDDNLIGNKKLLKALLPELKGWLERHDWPFEFSTEASMNLADDQALLDMLKETNFFAIFVGIESPDTETLIQAQKKQNTRREMADSIHKIYRAGILSVGPGQTSAGLSLGMTKFQVMRRIVLPQAVIRVIPPLSTMWVSLFKDTSILSAIGVVELMTQARHLAIETYRPLEIFTVAAAIYFVITYPQSIGVNVLYRRFRTQE